MDSNLTPTQMDIKRSAHGICRKEFQNVAKECDREEKVDFELLGKASELGFLGIFIRCANGDRESGVTRNDL